MPTDTSEWGLESLIVSSLTGLSPKDNLDHATNEEERPYGGAGYVQGEPGDYDRDHVVDLAKLSAFVQSTQPEAYERLALNTDCPTRHKFLARLQGQIAKRGVVDVLRNGVKDGPVTLDVFYGTPSPGNTTARERYETNIFSVTRQLRYSRDNTQLALDLCLFINGLPVATFELKNRLTKQTVDDAIRQYRKDRDPREPLFQFGRCLVHLAVDDQEVWMCTHLQGEASWFLPFNLGSNDGAGNPPNPHGLKTDYLWHRILTRDGLTDIIENYAQIVEEKDKKTGRKRRKQIFPRYHQLDVVHKLLDDVQSNGVGRRYLIEHSAGSGKSNSIAWLAHQLIGVRYKDERVFDSIIVVTDRRVLDRQINDTIKQFAQVSATVGHADRSGDLRRFIETGKKIIITTLQKFPFILDDIGSTHRDHTFAVIIDEAHSSQGGRTAARMNQALAANGAEAEEETFEDTINRLMEARKMLSNASYFAFTATPKNKTLELFGEEFIEGGGVKHRPFHSYTMKQAIQEQFILDVLCNYTPVSSYYRLIKTIPDDPQYDKKKAQKKLRRYVEGHETAIRAKAEVMVDHFLEQVVARRKIDGQARAMVVTGSIAHAIQYYQAIKAYLAELKSPYQALVAFSGEHDVGGVPMTEARMNGFPSGDTPEQFRKEPYRVLVCAEKFQTGYDEPLLHTMYVDKILSGIKAVQTLSRLNRAHPQKHDTFVLDFQNDADSIKQAFAPYYRTTILSDETDPNKLHDLKAELDCYQVYTPAQVKELVERYLAGADRARLDPILDASVSLYVEHLDEDEQVGFKGKSKAFIRTYGFLSTVLPYSYAEWEMLSIFLGFLVPKLPAPVDEDLSRGILESIDMDSYRAEVQAALDISLPDGDGTVDPVPTGGVAYMPEPELEPLSLIISEFNDLFGDAFGDTTEEVAKTITQDIPRRVMADKAYQNAKKNSDKENARDEHNRALKRVVLELLAERADLWKEFSDNDSFRKWLTERMFSLTYGAE